MDDLPESRSAIAPPRLVGWKAIAAYLGVSQRTAIRWADSAGLPVRRVTRVNRPSVVAEPAELDVWYLSSAATKARGEDLAPGGETNPGDSFEVPADAQPTTQPPPEAPTPGRRSLLLAAAAAVLVLAGLAFAVQRVMSPPHSATASRAAASPLRDRAQGRPLSLDRVRLRLGFEDQPPSTVVVKPGDMIRLETPSIWLGIQTRPEGGQLKALIFKLEAVPGGEAARHGLTVALEQGQRKEFQVEGHALNATWLSTEPGTPSVSSNLSLDPCCVVCRGINVCGEMVASTCGACKALEKAPDNVDSGDQSRK